MVLGLDDATRGRALPGDVPAISLGSGDLGLHPQVHKLAAFVLHGAQKYRLRWNDFVVLVMVSDAGFPERLARRAFKADLIMGAGGGSSQGSLGALQHVFH